MMNNNRNTERSSKFKINASLIYFMGIMYALSMIMGMFQHFFAFDNNGSRAVSLPRHLDADAPTMTNKKQRDSAGLRKTTDHKEEEEAPQQEESNPILTKVDDESSQTTTAEATTTDFSDSSQGNDNSGSSSITLMDEEGAMKDNTTTTTNNESHESASQVVPINTEEKQQSDETTRTTTISDDDKETILPTFPLFLDNTLITDIVWVPKQSKIVFIAARPKFFLGADFNSTQDFVQQNNFIPENLESPLKIQEHFHVVNSSNLKLGSCVDIPTKGSGDTRVDKTLFLVHCELSATGGEKEQQQQHLTLYYKDAKIAEFSHPLRLNAAASMEFRRQDERKKHITTTDDNNNNNGVKVAVVIKSLRDFSPYTTEIIEYYRRQGISHVYVTLAPAGGSELHEKYATALQPEGDFVSIGGARNDSITYQSVNVPVRRKMADLQSVLYHSKTFDDLLIVVDLDEIMVSMDPMEKSIVEVLGTQTDLSDTCFYTLTTNAAAFNNFGKMRKATKLSEKFPDRCTEGGQAAYIKSIAVVDNCDYVGIHMHGGCHKGTQRLRYVNTTDSKLLHFTDLWKRRWNQQKVTKMPCNVTNEFTHFMRSSKSYEQVA